MEYLSLDFANSILTATIYCAGFLDRLTFEAVASSWSRHKASNEDLGGFLWFARYQREGEYLKIRFYGSAAARDVVRESLVTAIQDFLGSRQGQRQRMSETARSTSSQSGPKDQCTTAYPDRTILWTYYQRVPGIMEIHPMFDDLLDAMLFTRCFGIASNVLENSWPYSNDTVPGALRISSALGFFTATCSSLGLLVARMVEYLRYTHGWQLTSFNIDLVRACERFNQRIQSYPEILEGLRPLLELKEERGTETATDDNPYGQRQEYFAELFRYKPQRVNDPEFLQNSYLKDQELATLSSCSLAIPTVSPPVC